MTKSKKHTLQLDSHPTTTTCKKCGHIVATDIRSHETIINPGEQRMLRGSPQEIFRGQKLVVISDVENLAVLDIRVGVVSQTENAIPLSADAFRNEQVSPEISFDTAQIGQEVVVVVQNYTRHSARVSAHVIGESVAAEEPKSEMPPYALGMPPFAGPMPMSPFAGPMSARVSSSRPLGLEPHRISTCSGCGRIAREPVQGRCTLAPGQTGLFVGIPQSVFRPTHVASGAINSDGLMLKSVTVGLEKIEKNVPISDVATVSKDRFCTTVQISQEVVLEIENKSNAERSLAPFLCGMSIR